MTKLGPLSIRKRQGLLSRGGLQQRKNYITQKAQHTSLEAQQMKGLL